MPAAHRREDPGVIGKLRSEPQRFEFLQAVRLALLWLEEQGVPPGTALTGHLRFSNSLSLGFPAAEIEHLDTVAGGIAGAAPQVTMTPTFMGLLGAHGTLPLHCTERILAWEGMHHDEGPRAFLDMLSGRMLALFYEALCKYRVEFSVMDGADSYLPMLLALAGREAPREAGSADGLRDETIALYAGLLQQRPVSSVALGRILSSHLKTGVLVQETACHWQALQGSEQTALGRAHAHLGDTALVGARSWRPDLRARIRLGPLSRQQYEHFLPRRPGAVALQRMLALFAEPTVTFEVELVLRAGEVQEAALGASARLGLDSFLVDGPVAADRTDMRYELRPMEPLPPRRAASPAISGAMPQRRSAAQ